MTGMWLGVLLCIAVLIAFWGSFSLAILIAIAVTTPVSIRGQRKVLRQMRANAYPRQEQQSSVTEPTEGRRP